MNEDLRPENIDFQGSRVSTNDSNEQENLGRLNFIESVIEEYPDLDSGRPLADTDLQDNEEISIQDLTIQGFRSDTNQLVRDKIHKRSWRAQLGLKELGVRSVIIFRACFMYLQIGLYHMFTTLLINAAIWCFMTLLVLSVAVRVAIYFVNTEVFNQDEFNLKQETDGNSFGSDREIRREQLRMHNGRYRGPQSAIQRRIAREYSQSRMRNIRRQSPEERQEEVELPIREPTRRDHNLDETEVQELGQMPLPTSSQERIETENILPRRIHLRNPQFAHHLRFQRHRREFLRNELLRLIASAELDRARQSNGTLLLRNLQMLQMSSIGREFNESDYEMLSQLDGQQMNRRLAEKNSIIISQLPTYSFKSKQGSPSPNSKLEAETLDGSGDHLKQDMSPEQKKNQSAFENEQRNTCTICIESFEDEQSIKLLPCFHQFHSSCIDDWLLRKSLCPVCKFDVSIRFNEADIL